MNLHGFPTQTPGTSDQSHLRGMNFSNFMVSNNAPINSTYFKPQAPTGQYNLPLEQDLYPTLMVNPTPQLLDKNTPYVTKRVIAKPFSKKRGKGGKLTSERGKGKGQKKKKRISKLACEYCRRLHKRCDGSPPDPCSRCVEKSRRCCYSKKNRRGPKTKQKSKVAKKKRPMTTTVTPLMPTSLTASHLQPTLQPNISQPDPYHYKSMFQTQLVDEHPQMVKQENMVVDGLDVNKPPPPPSKDDFKDVVTPANDENDPYLQKQAQNLITQSSLLPYLLQLSQQLQVMYLSINQLRNALCGKNTEIIKMFLGKIFDLGQYFYDNKIVFQIDGDNLMLLFDVKNMSFGNSYYFTQPQNFQQNQDGIPTMTQENNVNNLEKCKKLNLQFYKEIVVSFRQEFEIENKRTDFENLLSLNFDTSGVPNIMLDESKQKNPSGGGDDVVIQQLNMHPDNGIDDMLSGKLDDDQYNPPLY